MKSFIYLHGSVTYSENEFIKVFGKFINKRIKWREKEIKNSRSGENVNFRQLKSSLLSHEIFLSVGLRLILIEHYTFFD